MKWKKVIGGTLRIAGETIKKGDVIEASEKDLKGYIKQFKLVEGTIKTEPEPPKEKVKETPQFKVVHAGRGWYDVKSEDGKVMNEGKLRADDAEKLADQLNA